MNSLKITSKDLVSIVNDLKEKIKFNHISNKSLINYLFNYLTDNDIQLIESESRIILKNIDFELLDDNLLKNELEATIKKFESLDIFLNDEYHISNRSWMNDELYDIIDNTDTINGIEYEYDGISLENIFHTIIYLSLYKT